MASPQLSGYQCKFVDSVEDYECPLCLHVTREPSLTSCCGQHFCQACINKILTDKKPCPLCKNIGFMAFLDKKQKRKVLDLEVSCDEKPQGCEWQGSLGELEHHKTESCLFVPVSCSNNCGLTAQKRLLVDHQANECPNRPHSCQHCCEKGTYQDIQDSHLPVCPKYPVQCPNECGVSPLERAKLEDHLGECPLQLVECELREMGCEEMVQRKDLTRHMEEGAQRHLRLITSNCLQIVKNQSEMKFEMKNLAQENRRLRSDLAQTKIKLAGTEREVYELRDKLKNTSTAGQPMILSLAAKVETTMQYVKTSFVQFYVPKLSKQKGKERWHNSTEFYTFPSRIRMKINLYFHDDKVEIELTHLKSSVDDQLNWPMSFTMTVRMLNQTGDFGHFEVTKGMAVEHNQYADEIWIKYHKMEHPPRNANYIVNDTLKFQVFVEEL